LPARGKTRNGEIGNEKRETRKWLEMYVEKMGVEKRV